MAIKLSRINTGTSNWGGVANSNWGTIETAINNLETIFAAYKQSADNLRVGISFGGYIKYGSKDTNNATFYISDSYLTLDGWELVSKTIQIAITDDGITTCNINSFYILVDDVNAIANAAENSFFKQSWASGTAILYSADTSGKGVFSKIYFNPYIYVPTKIDNQQFVFNKEIAPNTNNPLLIDIPIGALTACCKYYALNEADANGYINLDITNFSAVNGLLQYSTIVKFATIQVDSKGTVTSYKPFECAYDIVRDSTTETYQLQVSADTTFGNNDYALVYTVKSVETEVVQAITDIKVTASDGTEVTV